MQKASGPIWTAAEDLAPPNGVRNPNHPARSELLYQLHYTDCHMLSVLMEMVWSFLTTSMPVWVTFKLFKITPFQWNILFPEKEQVPHSKLGEKKIDVPSPLGKVGGGGAMNLAGSTVWEGALILRTRHVRKKIWSFSRAEVNFSKLLGKMAVCPFWRKKFANRNKQFLYLGVLMRFLTPLLSYVLPTLGTWRPKPSTSHFLKSAFFR